MVNVPFGEKLLRIQCKGFIELKLISKSKYLCEQLIITTNGKIEHALSRTTRQNEYHSRIC